MAKLINYVRCGIGLPLTFKSFVRESNLGAIADSRKAATNVRCDSDAEVTENDEELDESSDEADFLPTLFGAKENTDNLNEDEQLLLKVEEFNMQQAVLRTKMRVKNNREEAIDFIAKVIFMVFGLMPLELSYSLRSDEKPSSKQSSSKRDPELELLTNEFKQSHLIYPALNVEQLERLNQEIGDYELILPKNDKYREFWDAHRELCLL